MRPVVLDGPGDLTEEAGVRVANGPVPPAAP